MPGTNNENIGLTLSTIFGGLFSGGTVLVLVQTSAVAAITAAVGGIVGFYVNRLLKKLHDNHDDNAYTEREK